MKMTDMRDCIYVEDWSGNVVWLWRMTSRRLSSGTSRRAAATASDLRLALSRVEVDIVSDYLSISIRLTVDSCVRNRASREIAWCKVEP